MTNWEKEVNDLWEREDGVIPASWVVDLMKEQFEKLISEIPEFVETGRRWKEANGKIGKETVSLKYLKSQLLTNWLPKD